MNEKPEREDLLKRAYQKLSAVRWLHRQTTTAEMMAEFAQQEVGRALEQSKDLHGCACDWDEPKETRTKPPVMECEYHARLRAALSKQNDEISQILGKAELDRTRRELEDARAEVHAVQAEGDAWVGPREELVLPSKSGMGYHILVPEPVMQYIASLRRELDEARAERYLPIDCAVCGRRRLLLMAGLVQCEKCGADADVVNAEMESLRSELSARTRERDEARAKIVGACEACWTNSWAPVPPDDPDAITMQNGMVARCDHCWVVDQLMGAREALRGKE